MATRFLLDTNTLTELARGNATAWDHAARISPSDVLWTCFAVVGEWEYGLSAAPTPVRRAQIAAAGSPVFAAMDGVWESSPAIAAMYGTIHAVLRHAGQMIPTNDVWIAAAARVHRATLVTSDPHFARVPGLRVVDWTPL